MLGLTSSTGIFEYLNYDVTRVHKHKSKAVNNEFLHRDYKYIE